MGELLLEDTDTKFKWEGGSKGLDGFFNWPGMTGMSSNAMEKPCCIELASNVFHDFRRQHADAIYRSDQALRDPRLHFPTSFDSDNLYARSYAVGGTLGSHVDH